jgi:hypothetical protein
MAFFKDSKPNGLFSNISRRRRTKNCGENICFYGGGSILSVIYIKYGAWA